MHHVLTSPSPHQEGCGKVHAADLPRAQVSVRPFAWHRSIEACCGVSQVLMQFGLGQQLPGGKFDWTHIQRHMTGRPFVSLEQVTRYAELVMLQLSEPANQQPFFADGIPKKDILQNYELNKVQISLC